jgi:ribosomal protein S18 acetylase RimI-like enzyme
MLTALVEQAQSLGYPGISLSVRDGNQAVRLYERAGFKLAPGTEKTNHAGSKSFSMLLRSFTNN